MPRDSNNRAERTFLGGALDSLQPSARVRRALTNDLELRRNDERTGARFSGYAFRGGADLVLRKGEFRAGRAIPDDWLALRGPATECFQNALLACEADPRLRYCEGYHTPGFGTPVLHGWCIAPDDGVVELTLPTRADELARYCSTLKLPFVPPQHWGYYGVIFDARLVRNHGDTLSVPMLDRGPAELAELEATTKRLMPDFSSDEPHDFPILRVPYVPQRTELP